VESSNNGKRNTPVWQWIAATALSAMIGIIGALTTEARFDLRDTKASTISLSARMAVLEKANEIQYANIKTRQDEIKIALDSIMVELQKHEQAAANCRK
jgi:hypothetical protein